MSEQQTKIEQVIESTLSRRRSSQWAAQAISSYASALPLDYLDTGMTRSDVLERAERQAHCGDAFVWSERDQRVVRGHYCQNPAICPICAHRVQSVRHARYAEASMGAARTHRAYHLVFTQRSRPGEALGASLGRLRACLRRFYLMGQRNRDGSRRGGEWGKVEGGLRGIEVKRGSGSGAWHVHAHALVFCSRPVDLGIVAHVQDAATGSRVPLTKIASEWLRATAGESHNVHVQAVDGGTGQSVVDAINETLKYTVWGGGTSEESRPADLVEALIACRGRRFFEPFGIMRGLGGSDYEVDPGSGPFIVYHHSPRWGYVPVECLDTLPIVERSALQKAIAVIIAKYRSARCKAERVADVCASLLDKMKGEMRAACSKVTSYASRMAGSVQWSSDEIGRLHREHLQHVFSEDVDPLPLLAT